METTETPVFFAGNGAVSLQSAHAPGQPLGRAVSELMTLVGVAELLAYGLEGAADRMDCAESSKHLARRLGRLSSELADLRLMAMPVREVA